MCERENKHDHLVIIYFIKHYLNTKQIRKMGNQSVEIHPFSLHPLRQVLVVVAPIVSSEEMDFLLKVTKRWGLAAVIDQYDMHVFVSKEYVAYA